MAQNYTEPSKKIYWKDYVKNIPDDDYFFFRSCIRQTFFPGAEQAFLFILKNHLHKNYFDDPRLTTCTGIGYHSDIIPLETLHTLIARHFSYERIGLFNSSSRALPLLGNDGANTWHEFPRRRKLERISENYWKNFRIQRP